MKFGGTPSNEGGERERGGIKRGKGGSRVGRALPQTKLLPDTRIFFSDASSSSSSHLSETPTSKAGEICKKREKIRGGVKNETGGKRKISFL